MTFTAAVFHPARIDYPIACHVPQHAHDLLETLCRHAVPIWKENAYITTLAIPDRGIPAMNWKFEDVNGLNMTHFKIHTPDPKLIFVYMSLADPTLTRTRVLMCWVNAQGRPFFDDRELFTPVDLQGWKRGPFARMMMHAA